MIWNTNMSTEKSNGTFTDYHSSGKKLKERNYKDDELNGKFTEWYEDGQIFEEGNYKDGKKDGKWTMWHENGKKLWEGNFKDDLLDGDINSWYENGQIQEEGNFKDGKKIYLNEMPYYSQSFIKSLKDSPHGGVTKEFAKEIGIPLEWVELEESPKEPSPEEDSKEPSIKQVSEVLLIDSYDLLVLLRKIGISKTEESDTITLSERKEVLQHLSDNGNPVAQCFLGSFYYADENYKEAFNLWSLAALQEDMLSEAMQDTINNNIGLAYYFGKGVKQDYKKASEWYLKSANSTGKRSQVSQYNLATMYLNGDGVDIDISKAKYYANKAREGSIQKYTNLAKKMCEKYNF